MIKTDLNYNEILLLSLYAEFYNKYYDYGDKQKKNNTLIRYLEMQYITFLVSEFGIYHPDCSFSWNGYCPYSVKLEEDLKKLDTKKKEILLFYKNYENIRKSNSELNYYEQLYELFSKYLYDRPIYRMAEVFYLLKDDVKEEESANLMASILYARDCMTVFSNEGDLESILKILNQYRKTEIDYNLVQNIWKDLAILGVVEMKYYQPIKNNEILVKRRLALK